MKKFNFGNFEGTIDTADYGFTKKFDDANEEFNNNITEIQKNSTGKRSDFIVKYCKAAAKFFNSIFGEGTSEQMFGDTLNLCMCDDAIFEVAQLVANDYAEYSKRANEKLAAIKATVGGNRAARRKK